MAFKEGFKKRIVAERREKDTLTYGEVIAMLAACDFLRDQVILALMAWSGLRIGEVVHIKSDWFDFRAQTITIPFSQEETYYTHSFYYKDKQRIEKTEDEKKMWSPKTVESAATIPILPWHDGYYPGILLKYFSSNNSIGLGTKSVYNYVVEAACKAGIKKKRVYPHILRHTFKRLLLEKGYRIDEVSRLMRHKNIATTDEYGHVRASEFCKDILKKW